MAAARHSGLDFIRTKIRKFVGGAVLCAPHLLRNVINKTRIQPIYGTLRTASPTSVLRFFT